MGKDQDRRKKKINWKTYNNELVERGKKFAKFQNNLREYVNKNWDKELKEKNDSEKRIKGGRKFEYPDTVFILLYIVKVFNRLSFRKIQGYATCMLDNVPNFRTIQDRIKALNPEQIKKMNDAIVKAKLAGKKLKIVLDGTGLQINDSYVWFEEKHKQKKRRKWKKVHFAADIESGIIVDFTVHEYNESEVETQRLLRFFKQVRKKVGGIAIIEEFFGDGGYDIKEFFEFLKQHGIKTRIKIDKATIEFIKRQLEFNKNKLAVKPPYPLWKPEDERQKEAVKQVEWNKYVEEEGYGQRSAIEGDIGSFKGSFGGALFSKLNGMIFREVLTKVLIYNVMRA